MALVKCPECKESISSDANVCPKCGKTIRYWTSTRVMIAIVMILIFIFGVRCYLSVMPLGPDGPPFRSK